MQLQITQTHAKIGVESTPANLNIRTQNAELVLQSEDAKINIHNEFPRVIISNRECFNTSGLKDITTFMKEAVQLGYQAASRYISKTAGNGDTLGAIENGSNPLPEIVKRDSRTKHEFNIDFMPKARPQITVTGSASMSADNALGGANNGISGSYAPGRVNFNVTPHNISIYMLQKPSINIELVGKNVDTYK